MRSLLRVLIVSMFVCFSVSADPPLGPPLPYDCEGGYSVPTTYEVTIRYYNASQQPVGWETYYCNGNYISHGNLSGTWIKETYTECCTGQTQTGYFYLCPDGIYHTVSAVGDTNCS
ncbi:MAG TPA: hypothetical protein VEK57_28685 [Thermoanaerobaculia bacterium]|nr:hypothetical protein [Thermoanaerobaculia bacterium]